MYVREEVEVWIDEEEVLDRLKDEELERLGYMRIGSAGASPDIQTIIKELRAELRLAPYSRADILLHRLESIAR